MNANLAAILYLVSGVLFILALRGLSSPETSRKGNTYGMVGMTIAVLTTLATLWGQGALDPVTLGLIIAGVAVGGGVGAVIARKVPMTSMPQLVAAFHSLVGMAACLVAVAAIYTPGAYHIALPDGSVQLKSLIELSLGLAIGAITFTGSVIAFAKLNGNMGGAPILLPARHLLNILIAAAIVALIVVLAQLAACLHFYAAMSLGHMFTKHKGLYSVLFFLGFSYLFNAVFSIFGVAQLSSDSFGRVETVLDSVRLAQLILGEGVGSSLIQGIAFYVATVLGLKKGLNLA